MNIKSKLALVLAAVVAAPAMAAYYQVQCFTGCTPFNTTNSTVTGLAVTKAQSSSANVGDTIEVYYAQPFGSCVDGRAMVFTVNDAPVVGISDLDYEMTLCLQ